MICKCCMGGVVLLLLVTAQDVLASGFNVLDIGPRRESMYAVIGRPDDTTAIMHNVAGLADQGGTKIFTGMMTSFVDPYFQFYCTDWVQGVSNCAPGELTEKITPDQSIGLLPFLGLSHQLTIADHPVTIGAAIYAPNVTAAYMPQDEVSRFFVIESLFITGYGTLALSTKLTDRLAVGIGLSYMYVYLTNWRRLLIEGLDEYNLSLDGTEHSGVVHAGVVYDLLDSLSIGLAFQSQANLVLEGDVHIGESYNDPQNSVYNIQHRSRIVVPWQLRFGVNFHPSSKLEVGLDVNFWRYSAFKTQDVELIYPETDEFLNWITSQIDLSMPRNFKDTWAIDIGVKYQLLKTLWYMGGVEYDQSPAPSKYLSPDMPMLDKYGIASGFEWKISDYWRTHISLTHIWYGIFHETESQTYPPANGKAVSRTIHLGLSMTFTF